MKCSKKHNCSITVTVVNLGVSGELAWKGSNDLNVSSSVGIPTTKPQEAKM